MRGLILPNKKDIGGIFALILGYCMLYNLLGIFFCILDTLSLLPPLLKGTSSTIVILKLIFGHACGNCHWRQVVKGIFLRIALWGDSWTADIILCTSNKEI